jgi:acyl carrier protein
MDNNAQIVDQLTGIFQSVFDDEGLVVTRELNASQVDGWDSLTHLRLVLSVERAFKVKFSAAETGKLKNVGDLIDLIAVKRQAAGR